MKEKLTTLRKILFEGEVTLPKVTLWLVGLLCLMIGIVEGLKKAPFTHGMQFGCNCGNHTVYNEDDCDCDCDCDCEECYEE